MTSKKDDSGATEGMDDSLLDPRGKANLEKAREMQDMRDETNAVADEQDGGQPLKRVDGFGSNKSAAIRDILLATPICPKSQIRGKLVAGQYEPPLIGPDDQNCQRAGKGWWNLCTDKGHNPYWRSVRVYHTVDETEVDENGTEWVTGTKKMVVKADKLNTTRVSPQLSHNSGIGIGIKMRDHGFRRISDFGYAEVCQYGGCLNLPTMRCQYGDYCSEAHMNLVAAKEEGVFLANHPTGTFDAEDQKKIQRFRESQLRNVAPRNVQRIQNG